MSIPRHPDSQRLSFLLLTGFGLVAILFAGVVICRPDSFFADDSYFYFQVAWNFAHGFGSTFNTLMPTNGYHPLWMLVCAAVFKLVASKKAAVHGIGAAISLFDAGALVLLYILLQRIARSFWWIAFFLYIPFSFLTQLGTEGALSGFFLAALVLAGYELTRSPSGRRGFLFALCGALAVLSRLDNIFVVSLIYCAVFLASPLPARAQIHRILLFCIPVYLVLWGAYVGSNLYWFGILQPISGMLKAHAHGGGLISRMPPHIPMTALAIILISVVILAYYRRDTFFRTIEAPFAAGIVLHALYITFIMSSETRWSWYYTSWVLLAAILLSRVGALVLAHFRPVVRNGLAAAALALLAVVWFKVSYPQLTHYNADVVVAGYQENMSNRLHLHTVLAYDFPGRMAYYTDVQVIALDGLMGNMDFERTLSTQGIEAVDRKFHVDAFVGPIQPLDESGRVEFCEQVHLYSAQFHCVPDGEGRWTVDRVDIFSRLTGKPAGSIALPPQNLLWVSDQVAIWKLP